MIEAAAGLEETYAVEVEGVRVAVRVRDGAVEVTPGVAEDAAVRIITDRQGFIGLARGNPGDRVQIEGEPEAIARMQSVFSLA